MADSTSSSRLCKCQSAEPSSARNNRGAANCIKVSPVLVSRNSRLKKAVSMLGAAAAAAKSLQSCPTLCDPMDCSLPGSSVHGIFQARVLEWGAIAFSIHAGRALSKPSPVVRPSCEPLGDERVLPPATLGWPVSSMGKSPLRVPPFKGKEHSQMWECEYALGKLRGAARGGCGVSQSRCLDIHICG